MTTKTQRMVRWSVGTTLWMAGLLSVTPVTGFVLAPIADAVISVAPGWFATASIETFGEWATRLLLGGTVVSVIAGAGVIGYRRGEEPGRSIPVLGSFLAPAFVALLLYVVSPSSITLFGILLVGATGVPPYVFMRLDVRAEDSGADHARRGALRRIAGGGTAVTALAIGARSDSILDSSRKPERSAAPLSAEYKRLTGRTIGSGNPGNVSAVETTGDFGFDFAGMPPRIEGIEAHYVVDKNTQDPSAAADDWELSVTGAVEDPASFTLDALIDHPEAVSVPGTLICISNHVGGDLISTTTWQAVPLSAIVDQVGVVADEAHVVTTALDGYSESVPLQTIQDVAYVAFGADGSTLPVSHGFPARLLLPGRYGFKSTKWLTEIEFARHDHEAYWEQRGWDERAMVNTLSYARAIAKRDDEIAIGGIAYAGTRGIDAVEISRDGGDTWVEAELEPAPSRFAWNRWRRIFSTPDSTQVDVVVRARDGTGALQTSKRTKSHPGGATGWHRETFYP